MNSRMLGRAVAVAAIGFVCASAAFGQTWQGAQRGLTSVPHKVYVVTIAEPKKRHACMVESISADEIVCKHVGHAAVYKAGDVAALIEPGVHTRWYLWFAGFLGAGVAATWGTVALVSICPVCAAATGIAAFFFYMFAPYTAMGADGDGDGFLLYLAPGQRVQVKVK